MDHGKIIEFRWFMMPVIYILYTCGKVTFSLIKIPSTCMPGMALKMMECVFESGYYESANDNLPPDQLEKGDVNENTTKKVVLDSENLYVFKVYQENSLKFPNLM